MFASPYRTLPYAALRERHLIRLYTEHPPASPLPFCCPIFMSRSHRARCPKPLQSLQRISPLPRHTGHDTAAPVSSDRIT